MNDETEILQRLTAAEQAVKSAQHQIDEMKDIVTSIHFLASEVKYMRTDISKIQNDIDLVKGRPLKFYDKLLWAVIGSVVSGAIAAIINLI